MKVDNSFSYATHKPVLQMVKEVFAPDAVMEFGIGMHSTPLFSDVNYIGVENDMDWIRIINKKVYPDAPVHKHFIWHRLPSSIIRSTPFNRLGLNEEPLMDYYRGLPQPKGERKLLFADCYAGTRQLVLKAIKEDFDIIVYHDAQPIRDGIYGYHTVDFTGWKKYYLKCPTAWTCFLVKESVRKELMLDSLRCHIRDFKEEFNLSDFYMQFEGAD